ncbi:hypothetical protein OAG85_03635 [Verrucomicrobiales bacterium]|nr:hypothetical protein [Verrucomicrobiales bacterium]
MASHDHDEGNDGNDAGGQDWVHGLAWTLEDEGDETLANRRAK